MKMIFKEAHKMTREMVKEYEVDYQAQFGLNLSYLLNKKEVEEVRELEGTDNQVKWANDLLDEIDIVLEDLAEGAKELWPESKKKQNATNKRVEFTREQLNKIEHAGEIIERFKSISYKQQAEKAEEILGTLQALTCDAGFRNIGVTYPGKLVAYIYDKAKERV